MALPYSIPKEQVLMVESSRFDRIERAIEEIRASITALQAASLAREQSLGRLESLAVSLDKAIRGNGKPGLNSRMDAVEKEVADMEGLIETKIALAPKTVDAEAIRDVIEEEENGPGSWREFRKQMIWPVFTSALTAVIIAFIMKFL